MEFTFELIKVSNPTSGGAKYIIQYGTQNYVAGEKDDVKKIISQIVDDFFK